MINEQLKNTDSHKNYKAKILDSALPFLNFAALRQPLFHLWFLGLFWLPSPQL